MAKKKTSKVVKRYKPVKVIKAKTKIKGNKRSKVRVWNIKA